MLVLGSIEDLDDLDTESLKAVCFLGDYVPLNPDIDRPSPPRQGSSRIFENPFELNDEETHPVTPEKLSPSHVFESSTFEEELLRQSETVDAKPVFDSRTFVVKKTPSPTNSTHSSGFPGMKVP